MQVGALGLINSVSLPIGHEQSEQESGFASLLKGITQLGNSGLATEQQSVNVDGQQLSLDELHNLLQLLHISDLSEMELGSEILGQLLSNNGTDLNGLILKNLQITEDDLKSAITSILNAVNGGMSSEKLEVFKEDAAEATEEITILLKEIPQMDGQESLMAFMQILPLFNLDGITLKNDRNFSNLAQTLKLLQLLSNYEKMDVDQKSLKDLLKIMENSLDTFIKEDRSMNRKEYLQKIFTPVIKEANENTLTNSQTKPILSSTELVDGDISGGMFQFQQMSKPEQLTLLQPKSGQPVSTEEIIGQFEKILSKSHLFKAGGTQRLFIKLYPEHLGALKVELIQKDSSLIAKIVTTNSTAKDLLESQLHSLKQAFGVQNIQLDKIEIFQQMSPSERFLNKDFQQQNQHQEQRKNEEQKQRDDDQTFSRSFEEALISAEA